MSDPKAPTIHLDRAALAVLAHPLRSRLLAELRVSGPATATTLAAVLQTNSGATSYHLRKLAQVALVVDSGEGRGRRRLWS
ncbi:MAG: winged helix-turn-helix domain-containing protein, partial [Dermatophilaceae bacterium]